jgi:hypothetical protein
MESAESRARIRDVSEFPTALGEGTLPAVAFVKPHWAENAHANSSTVGAGDRFVRAMVGAGMARSRAAAQRGPLRSRHSRPEITRREAFDFSQPPRAAIALD